MATNLETKLIKKMSNEMKPKKIIAMLEKNDKKVQEL